MSFYSQKCPCNVFSATSYSDGIAIIAALSDSIIIQLLKINFNKNDEPTIFNTCSKQIKLQKEVEVKKLLKIIIIIIVRKFSFHF